MENNDIKVKVFNVFKQDEMPYTVLYRIIDNFGKEHCIKSVKRSETKDVISATVFYEE